MKFETISVGNLSTNCYIVYDEILKKGIIIDPGADGNRIIAKAMELEVQIEYVVFTHFHFDHILAYHKVKGAFPSAVTLISEKEEPAMTDETKSLLFYTEDTFEKITDYNTVKEGDLITFGEASLKVIETPGHTQGCICLYGNGILFSGDTLFYGSVGRWDFPGGSLNDELSSIREKLFILPEDTRVYPGHGENTTIKYEKENNLILKNM